MQCTKNKNHSIPKIKIISIVLSLFLTFAFLNSCANTPQVSQGMTVGSEGVDFAKKLVAQFPYRKAYSDQEKSVAALIVDELKTMNYKPEVVTFGSDQSISQNIIIRIPGSGFQSETSATESTPENAIHKQVIVGAHYDTMIGIEQKEAFPDYDGIQENASGVGALISIAKELKNKTNGYDVVLVFFGAGDDNFAGAMNFLAGMTEEEIAETDAMYCIESIYAGDKLYAHAGINSIQKGTKYEKRRKLYEISDVAIANSIDLRFNESDLDVDVNNDKVMDVYREITITKSDYSVFDNVNIPCVFMESYDYFGSTMDVQQESKNPAFGATNGKIRGTNFDSLLKLSAVLDADRLETRIKNVAFLIVKAIEKGMYRSTISSNTASSNTTSVNSSASIEG